MSKKFFIIYKTTNIKNNKFYIGMHQTNNLDDTYLGSGSRLLRSIRYHGKENFKRKILFCYDNPEEMVKKEIELITEELISNPLCMNIMKGGTGGNIYNGGFSDIAQLAGKKHSKRLKDDPGYKEMISNKIKLGQKKAELNGWIRINPFKYYWLGKTHSEETRERMRNHKGKQEGNKNSQYGTIWITNIDKNKNRKIRNNESIPDGWIKGRKIK